MGLRPRAGQQRVGAELGVNGLGGHSLQQVVSGGLAKLPQHGPERFGS